MKSWAARMLRVFGGLHVIMGVVGIGGVVWMYVLFAGELRGPISAYPYELQFYIVYTILDLLCFVFLIRAGAALWRLEPRGRWLSNLVLGFEAIWLFSDWGALGVVLDLWGNRARPIKASIDSIFPFARIPMMPQMFSAYPLIALIAINVAYRKLRRAAEVGALQGDGTVSGWKPWPRAMLKTFGILDVVGAVYGLTCTPVWFEVNRSILGVDAAHPYVLSIYRTETGFAVLYFLLLIPTGLALWRLRRLGWWMSCALFASAVFFLLAELGLQFILPLWGGEARALGHSFENSFGTAFYIVPIMLYSTLAFASASVAFIRLRQADAPQPENHRSQGSPLLT